MAVPQCPVSSLRGSELGEDVKRVVFVTGKMITVGICLRDCRLVPEIRATTSLGFKYFHTRPSSSPGGGVAGGGGLPAIWGYIRQ